VVCRMEHLAVVCRMEQLAVVCRMEYPAVVCPMEYPALVCPMEYPALASLEEVFLWAVRSQLRGCPGAHLFGNYMLNERRGVTFNFRAAGLKPSLFILPIKSGKRTLK